MTEAIEYTVNKMPRNKPMDELVFLFGKFGWQTRLCDLNEKQVLSLIYGIQEAHSIEEDHAVRELENNYIESTGTWPTTSIPF